MGTKAEALEKSGQAFLELSEIPLMHMKEITNDNLWSIELLFSTNIIIEDEPTHEELPAK